MCVPLLHACHSRALTLEMVARSRSRMCATVTVGRTLHALLCALVQSLCAAVMVRDKGSLWVRLALLNIMCYRRVSFVFVSRGPSSRPSSVHQRLRHIYHCVVYDGSNNEGGTLPDSRAAKNACVSVFVVKGFYAIIRSLSATGQTR